MKLHKQIAVEMAASKDKARYAISEPFLDIKDGKGTLVSTDGRIMALIPVDVDAADSAGYVSAEVLKASRKCYPRGDEMHVALSGVATLANGATLPRAGNAKDANYPNWRQVNPVDEGYTMSVSIDAKRLWQLAQAMGTQCVILRIKNPDSPLLVQPNNGGTHSDVEKFVCAGARGVIMPIKLPTP